MDKLLASSIALGVALCLGLTFAVPEPVQATVAPPEPPKAQFTAAAGGWDVGVHTEHTLKGLQELLQSLNDSTPRGELPVALVVQYATIQAMIAHLVSTLPAEDQAMCQELSRELFELSQSKSDKKKI
jgi:hypothetical protein